MGENFRMGSGENFEQRITAVEHEVALARSEAAAARALAAGADRDVADYRAEMRAHTRALAALRQTQIDHYAEHKADLNELRVQTGRGFSEIKAGQAEIKAGQAEIKAGVAHVVRLLEERPGSAARQ
jgi:hypothetical protein